VADILTIRVNDRIQAKFKDLAEASDFRNQAEFLSHLLVLYAAQETSLRVPTLEGAVSAIQEMADKVTKILIGTGETILISQEKVKEQMEGQRREAEEKVRVVAAENESLKVQISTYQTKLKNVEAMLAETKEHEKSLDLILDDKIALIAEYRDKISDLESEISRQKNLIADAADAQSELENLRLVTKEQILKIEHQELEKEKALVELEKTLMREMADQRSIYAANVNEYEKKVMSLLETIGGLKPQT